MSYYKIQGGRRLTGEIKVNSSKNAAVALLCASLLNKGKTEFANFPELEETKRVMEVLESIGARFSWLAPRRLQVTPPKKLELGKINFKSASATRSVLLLLGPLIHQLKKFNLPKPSGCKLGERTVRPHLYALEHFGVKIKSTSKYYEVACSGNVLDSDIVLYESGDTVTENAVMAAALCPKKTVIKLASANYMVQEICFYLELLGVRFEGLGTATLTVWGKKNLNRTVKYTLAEDPIEAMLFLSLAATTDSAIAIKGCPIEFLELELLKLEKMGFNYKITRHYFAENGRTRLVDIKTGHSDLEALEDKIYGRPFPGLNIDNLPFFVPIAARAKGRTLIHDWVYENRAIYYTELSKLGAKVSLADAHRVYIDGPSVLRGNEIICPPALRPGVIILIAMLSAKGPSILRNIYSIERGYEHLDQRLKKLGAKIEKMDN